MYCLTFKLTIITSQLLTLLNAIDVQIFKKKLFIYFYVGVFKFQIDIMKPGNLKQEGFKSVKIKKGLG